MSGRPRSECGSDLREFAGKKIKTRVKVKEKEKAGLALEELSVPGALSFLM